MTQSIFFPTRKFFLSVVVLLIAFQAQSQTLPGGLTPQQVNAHVIDPAELRGIISDGEEQERSMPYVFRPQLKFNALPKLNVNAFGQELHAKIKDQVTGYAMQLRKNGAPVYTLIWNWAKTPTDGGQGWKLDTRMHVASVSKYITAVAMVKLLDSKGISLDAKIINYLPAHWVKGPKINQISFRNLLTHTSGFSTGTSSSNYTFMKQNVANGVAGVGGSDYENMNFGLCRLLLAVINGNIPQNFNAGPLTDQVWDMVSINAYKNYCQTQIFNPAGVANASFVPLPAYKNALAYKFPHNGEKGWNSGDLSSMAGGAAWRLSVDDLLKVMDHVRRRNTILQAGRTQQALDAKLGIDIIKSTPAGNLYSKNGSWSSGGRSEKSVIFFMPEGMELVLLVNSKVSANDWSIRGIVQDLYIDNLVDPN
ncbi:MAG TPA: serine hydrolase domain-containing protein [Haliscomenobacter sp.]|uniref:serine hydrolase domain-containing protein n=1 Tax=Haliscomenobacter sp. TaxID=2717303 RepID=UPI002BEE05D5|nr:serine hydrolase domain-containing protein [Haliscomenobacter sp.]HOY19911.1 serine hydrolase domain-containing protein [Haliscomenobacter sp.]HPH18811.1 serine hydrolase domain-containing protein [Haliscomenobacter sp.]